VSLDGPGAGGVAAGSAGASTGVETAAAAAAAATRKGAPALLGSTWLLILFYPFCKQFFVFNTFEN